MLIKNSFLFVVAISLVFISTAIAGNLCNEGAVFKITKHNLKESHPEIFHKLETGAELSDEELTVFLEEARKTIENTGTNILKEMFTTQNNPGGCLDYSLAQYRANILGESPETAIKKTIEQRPYNARVRPGSRAKLDVVIAPILDGKKNIFVNGQKLDEQLVQKIEQLGKARFAAESDDTIKAYLEEILTPEEFSLINEQSILVTYDIPEAIQPAPVGSSGFIGSKYIIKTTLQENSSLGHVVYFEKISPDHILISDPISGKPITKILSLNDASTFSITLQKTLTEYIDSLFAELKSINEESPPTGLARKRNELKIRTIQTSLYNMLGIKITPGNSIRNVFFLNSRLITIQT
jgi:hypothetical protein